MTDLSVDALYSGFVASLPPRLRGVANDLPYALKLAPSSGIGWSEVFNHEVTLSAPRLVTNGLGSVHGDRLRNAVLAHSLAIIEAFGRDRVADEQVKASPELVALFALLRERRDQALEQVWPGAANDAHAADAETRAAIHEERALLCSSRPVTAHDYVRISLGKQAVGFPASRALARAAGASDSQVLQVTRMLCGVWLGLQFEDDVVDWEDDWRHGGAWAVSLSQSLRSARAARDSSAQPELVRRAVLNSGVLRTQLEYSRRQYRRAWRHAQSLGSDNLAFWARRREDRLAQIIPLESRHAGYAVRMNKLGAWAFEVLS